MFSFLIGRNADINFKDLRQASALQHAVGRGQSEMVLVLLDKGADVNTADIEANTPLLVALHNQEWELARELIQRGADPKAKNEMRDSAVTLAGQSGNMDLFLQFWDKGADNDALLRDLAFRGAPDEILQLLFDQGAGSNNANVDQALWEAAAGCHLDTIRFFLAHGANPNATNDDMGITACETRYNSCKGPNEREEIQKYLVERGCIIDGKP